MPSQSVIEGNTANWPTDPPTKSNSLFEGWYSDPGLTNKYNFATEVTGNIFLYAKWYELKDGVYMVKFDSRGGSPVDSWIISDGTTTPPPSPPPPPTRSPYHFGGWYEDAGLTEEHDFDEQFTKNITLYARWYSTVTYNANGATSGTAPASVQINAGSSTTLPDQGSLSRPGYSFGGWSTQANGNGTVTSPYTPTGDITLYARWYSTVTFNANGATGTAPAQVQVNAGSSITLPGQGTLAPGYTFDGWLTQGDSNGNGNGSVTSPYMPTGDITLYAHWYSTVTYNANGATSGTAPASGQVYRGSSITIPDQGTLSRPGYSFGGWNTQANGNGTNRNIGELYTPAGNTTFYARWYSTVTFNANGATSGTAPASVQVNAGSSTPLPVQGSLLRTGYSFGGWNTQTDGNGTNRNANTSYTPTGDITLYARWYRTVIFNANGATGTLPNPNPVEVNPGSPPITLPSQGGLAPGYTFGGWLTIGDGNGNGSGTVTSPYTPTAETNTLYARWYSTVTFNANGATGTLPNPNPVEVNPGSSITLPERPGDLSRPGYTFGGWNTQTDGNGTNYDAGDSYTPTGNINLYARWYSTVTFDPNGATGTAPAPVQVNAGSSTTLPNPGDLLITGYTFGGWNTQTDGNGTNYDAGDSYTPAGDITLHACWDNSM